MTWIKWHELNDMNYMTWIKWHELNDMIIKLCLMKLFPVLAGRVNIYMISFPPSLLLCSFILPPPTPITPSMFLHPLHLLTPSMFLHPSTPLTPSMFHHPSTPPLNLLLCSFLLSPPLPSLVGLISLEWVGW